MIKSKSFLDILINKVNNHVSVENTIMLVQRFSKKCIRLSKIIYSNNEIIEN